MTIAVVTEALMQAVVGELQAHVNSLPVTIEPSRIQATDQITTNRDDLKQAIVSVACDNPEGVREDRSSFLETFPIHICLQQLVASPQDEQRLKQTMGMIEALFRNAAIELEDICVVTCEGFRFKPFYDPTLLRTQNQFLSILELEFEGVR